ncbi:MAG: queuosine precursor transporter [Alphaproteobacteria bacterium]
MTTRHMPLTTIVPFKTIAPFAAMMITLVLASNILVHFHINSWLTYGAFSYPLTFLVSDLCNRLYGITAASRVVKIGLIGMGLTFVFAYFDIGGWGVTYRVGVAAVLAYIIGQTADLIVFDKLRQATWWRAPMFSSLSAAFLDSVIFYSLAFYGILDNWLQLSMGDFAIKLIAVAFGVIVYRPLLKKLLTI